MFSTLFVAVLSAAASEAPVGIPAGRVSITLERGRSEVGREIEVVLEPDAAGAEGVIRRTIRENETTEVQLREGNWSLGVDSTVVWHARQHFYVSRGETVPLKVSLWPRVEVAGKVTFKSKTIPRELLVRFEDAARPIPKFSGEIACPIVDGAFQCALPAGRLNLRLRPRGFIGHFLADVKLNAAETRNLGTLDLREGQSITGRVELPREYERHVSKVIVTAMPLAADAMVAGTQLLPMRTTAEKNGFFHVDGVAPGTYVVRAAYEQKLFSDSVEVEVRVGREAELIDRLRLDEPRRIFVTISPSLSLDGNVWSVRLEKSTGERQVETVTESSATTGGQWMSPPVQPGRYDVTVRNRQREVWSRKSLIVEREDFDLLMAVVPRSVRGEVRLGEKPLRASVTIAASSGFRITATSDEHGQFEAILPMTEDARWNVDVQADTPHVRRRLSVEPPAHDGTLSIELPQSVLMGSVTTAQGTPVDGAIVNLLRGDAVERLVQTSTARDGTFVIHGLAPGSYSVVAADFLAESDPQDVEIREDDIPQPVSLVVRGMNELRGRVLSPAGPVAGASVFARAVDVDQSIVARRPTNAAGEFGIAVPADARRFEMNVAAPGFAFVITSAVHGDRPVAINVDQRGGTLAVRTQAGVVPYLVHNDATIAVQAIEHTWPVRRASLDDEAQETVIPSIEPGAYSACVVNSLDEFRRSAGRVGGRCVSGFLAPLGSLTLDLR